MDTVNDLINEMFTIAPGEDVIDMTDFLFEGFDPKAILESLLKIVKKKKIKTEDFKQDMSTIIAICCNRGPINKKVMARMKDEGKTRTIELISKYGIKIDVGVRELTRSDITPSRIVNVFPFSTMDICAGSDWARQFVGHFNSTELPKCMLNTSFSACIPRGTSCTEILMRSYMLFSMDLADVTGGGIDPDKYSSVYSSQLNFAQAAMNASLFKNDQKIKKLKEHHFNTRDMYQKLTSLIQAFCRIMQWTFEPVSSSDYLNAFK